MDGEGLRLSRSPGLGGGWLLRKLARAFSLKLMASCWAEVARYGSVLAHANLYGM